MRPADQDRRRAVDAEPRRDAAPPDAAEKPIPNLQMRTFRRAAVFFLAAAATRNVLRSTQSRLQMLAFCGIATNVCVESTLRDGFHLEYFGVMLEDATHHLGPPAMQDATVYNVEKFFGWVSNTADFCGTISQAPPGS